MLEDYSITFEWTICSISILKLTIVKRSSVMDMVPYSDETKMAMGMVRNGNPLPKLRQNPPLPPAHLSK